jgi:AcrR family transcriptional regulator
MSISARTRAPRMSPADRYAQLLPAIEGVFVARGYSEVSMEDLADAAGVTRPVINNYFGGKEGAFLACVKHARDLFETGLREYAEGKTTLREQIEAGATHFFATLEHDPARWKLLFSSAGVLSGPYGDELAKLRFDTIEQVRLIIAAGAPDAPADRVEACAHAISGAGERLGHWWLTRPDIARATIIDHFLEIVWAGLDPYVDG